MAIAGEQLDRLLSELCCADVRKLRVMRCADGVKFKVNSNMWTPALGELDG